MEKIWIMALEMEKRARDFYLARLEQVEDPRVRTTLAWLADWEREHVTFVEARLRGERAAPLAKGEPHPPEAPGPGGMAHRDPARVAMELATLRTAQGMELDAQDFYRAAAARASSPEEHRVFEDLAGWETEHWKLLDRNYQELSREYWEDMGFEPF